MATHFLNLVGIGGAKVVEMLSGGGNEGFEGIMLTCETSSFVMLMVVGGTLTAIGARVGGAGMIAAMMPR